MRQSLSVWALRSVQRDETPAQPQHIWCVQTYGLYISDGEGYLKIHFFVSLFILNIRHYFSTDSMSCDPVISNNTEGLN